MNPCTECLKSVDLLCCKKTTKLNVTNDIVVRRSFWWNGCGHKFKFQKMAFSELQRMKWKWKTQNITLNLNNLELRKYICMYRVLIFYSIAKSVLILIWRHSLNIFKVAEFFLNDVKISNMTCFDYFKWNTPSRRLAKSGCGLSRKVL